VSAENKAARFNTTLLHSVLIRLFSSSMVKKFLFVSARLMGLIFAFKSMVKYPSLYACFKAAFSLLK
jgi:hypothetical protein